MNELFISNLEENYLPRGASVIRYEDTEDKKPAILYGDIDGDDNEEIIIGYRVNNRDFVTVLKQNDEVYNRVGTIPGKANGLKRLLIAPVINNENNNLIISWRGTPAWSMLEVYTIKDGNIRMISQEGKYYTTQDDNEYEDEESRMLSNLLNFSSSDESGYSYTDYYSKLPNKNHMENQNNNSNAKGDVIIDVAQGFVLSKRFMSKVFLVGKEVSEGGYYEDIRIMYKSNERSRSFTYIDLKENSGYNPTIGLYNFMDNDLEQAMVVFDTGGSGGYIVSYIYSLMNGEEDLLFDFDSFNGKFLFDVTYQDNYLVEVAGGEPRTVYLIDISQRPDEYLDKLYDKDGKLVKEASGGVLALGGIYPVDFARNGVYQLQCMQRVIGMNNADNLGVVNTILEYTDDDLAFSRQTLGILPG